MLKCELYHDNFQNYKSYNIPRAQLILTDIPYNLGKNAYASNPAWYNDGDNSNGESKLAAKPFFNCDGQFHIEEYFHFCSRLLIKEPKEKNAAPAMIIFCAFEQIEEIKRVAAKHGFVHSYPLVFVKNSSAQVLKANMKIVGATEYAVVLYRDKLPKFRNEDENGKKHMIKNWFEYSRDGKDIPRIHPTQKPINILKKLIEIFTDPGDVVIDPCAGSGTTLRAAYEIGRNAYGFEIDRAFYNKAKNEMLVFDNVKSEDAHKENQFSMFTKEVS